MLDYRLTYSGLIHPFIHLSFGLEFNQPAIVAQGLAQAAVHDDWLGRAFFLPAEKMSAGVGVAGKKSLLELLNECRADKALTESVKWADSNKIKDGVMTRAPEQMIKYAAQFTVSEDQIEERLADMINTVGKCVSVSFHEPLLSRLVSLLHQRRTASDPRNETGLLLHPLCQLIHLLLQDHQPPIPGSAIKAAPHGMERTHRPIDVCLTRVTRPPPGRGSQIPYQGRLAPDLRTRCVPWHRRRTSRQAGPSSGTRPAGLPRVRE
jgi:hypothetical protein